VTIHTLAPRLESTLSHTAQIMAKRTFPTLFLAVGTGGLAAITSLALHPTAAKADQAYCLDQADAKRAYNLLVKEATLRHFCEPCGDRVWKEEAIKTVVIMENGGQGCPTSIQVNGKSVDLAYVYVPRSWWWQNVALLLNEAGSRLDVQRIPKYLPPRR